jgi:CBS domain-containing protein
MRVKDIMTTHPVCCTPDTSLQRIAEMMVENDCGEIPIISDAATHMLVGVLTDRDITCRTVARGLNPLAMTAAEVMTTQCISATPETSLDECCRLMEANQIRRIPVVDGEGACCGIVALADIANHAAIENSGEVVQEVSKPRAFSAGVTVGADS